MATEGSRILGCPKCGLRVDPRDEECPRCGNKFVTETKFECPFCGELVPRGAEACPTCFVNFSEFQQRASAHASDESIDKLLIEIINMEASEAKIQDKRFSCPKCSWLLDGSEETCPKCGMAFTADAAYQCPVCGAIVSAAAEVCGECGTAFSEEAKAIQEDERRRDVEAMLTELLDALGGRVDEETRMPATVAPPAEPERSVAARTEIEPAETVSVPSPLPTDAETRPTTSTQTEEEVAQNRLTQTSKQTPKKTRTRKLKAKPAGPKA